MLKNRDQLSEMPRIRYSTRGHCPIVSWFIVCNRYRGELDTNQ